MAVQIDVPAFRGSIPAEVTAVAERLLHEGGVGELESVGGGARAVVRDGGNVFQPWVGVVERDFSGDCDCAPEPAGERLCAHAVAVALAAFDAGVRFSVAGEPHGEQPAELSRAGLRQAVQRLTSGQLTELAVEYAARDRLFATLLLGRAGMLDPADQSGLAAFQAVIEDAASVTSGDRWEIADVEHAGHRLADEVEILCAWPATLAMLDLVEEAIEVWDELSGHLIDAYEIRRTDPDQISDLIVYAHRDLCERLELDPDEIAGRLTRLLESCAEDTIDVDAYAELIGDRVP